MPYQSAAGPIPNGNAFLVNTPKFDAAANSLWVQHQQDQIRQQREHEHMQDMFARELANVRGADTPEIVDAYSNYKDLKQKQLFDPKVRHDARAYNDLDNQIVKAQADYYTKVDESKRLKGMTDDLLKIHGSHPEKLVPDFRNKYDQLMGTPMSKLGELSNPDTYSFKDTFDYNKARGIAMGKPIGEFSENAVSPDGLQTTVTPYKLSNNPNQFKDAFLNELSRNPNGLQAAKNNLAQVTDDQYNQIRDLYLADNPQKWNRTTGQPKPINVDPANPANPAERYASYATMVNWLHSNPVQGKQSTITNVGAKMNAQNEENEKMNDIKFKQQKILTGLRSADALHNAKAILNAREEMSNMKEADKTAFVNQNFNEEINDATTRPVTPIPTQNGGTLEGFDYKTSPIVEKLGEYRDPATGHTSFPEQTVLSKDGKKLTFVYTMPDPKDKNKIIVDDSKTKSVPIQEAKDAWRKEIVGKYAGRTDTKKPETKPAASSKPKQVKQNGVIYTLNPKTGEYE